MSTTSNDEQPTLPFVEPRTLTPAPFTLIHGADGKAVLISRDAQPTRDAQTIVNLAYAEGAIGDSGILVQFEESRYPMEISGQMLEDQMRARGRTDPTESA